MSQSEEKAGQLPESFDREADRAESPGADLASAAEGEPRGIDTDESPQALVERLTRELEGERDQRLREKAELDNFKKRMQRERADALRFASAPLLRDLLPTIDNLERAVGHALEHGEGESMLEGVQLVLKSALAVLEQNGVERVEAVGQTFDPTRHEAVAQVLDSNREPNQVIEQFLPGYRLHGRLLRPAQVSVSSRPAVENPPNDG